MPSHATRNREEREEIATAVSLHVRLHAAIIQFDSDASSPLGVPNMATPIRLLACSGKGNQLLQRLCDRLNIPLPTIIVSAKPNTGIEASLSVGSVPMSNGGEKTTDESVSLALFLERECVVIDADRDRVVITWDNLLRSISEKRGYIHSDAQVPTYFDELDTLFLSDLKLVDFMFRHAAAAIANAAHTVLTSIGVSALPAIVSYAMPNRISQYWFGMSGILETTPAQKTYMSRLDAASRRRVNKEYPAARAELQAILSECRTAETLFYKRLCALAKLELGYTEFEAGHPATSQLLASQVAAENHNSTDSKLREYAENAMAFLGRR